MGDIELKIEQIEYKKRRGRFPSSKEYSLGNQIWEKLKCGDSTWIGEIYNSRTLLIRLSRLSASEGVEREYNTQIEGEGFRIFRTK